MFLASGVLTMYSKTDRQVTTLAHPAIFECGTAEFLLSSGTRRWKWRFGRGNRQLCRQRRQAVNRENEMGGYAGTYRFPFVPINLWSSVVYIHRRFLRLADSERISILSERDSGHQTGIKGRRNMSSLRSMQNSSLCLQVYWLIIKLLSGWNLCRNRLKWPIHVSFSITS